MDERLYKYIADVVAATRNPQNYDLGEIKHFIEFGASPRASINTVKAAKAYAFLQKRGFVTPQDIKNVAYDILRHRIAVSYEAEAENITSYELIEKVLQRVDVP